MQVFQRLQKLNLCVSHHTAAPTYSLMSSDDEMPNVECDILNINEAVLLPPHSVPLIPAQRSAEENDSGHAFGDRSEENRVQVMEVQTNEICRPEGTPTTYKLVGDNLDLTVKARYMRIDGQKDQSLHYFHHMSVCDRIEFSHLPISRAHTCLNSPSNLAVSLLPDVKSDESLISDLSVLVSRIIVTHLSYFNFTFSDVVKWHLEHQYYKEMSKQSTVVSND